MRGFLNFVRDGLAFVGLLVFIATCVAIGAGLSAKPASVAVVTAKPSLARVVAPVMPLPRSARPTAQQDTKHGPCFVTICKSLLVD